MKILWVTNTAFDVLSEHLYGRKSGGAWMGALLKDFERAGEHTLVVATVADVKTTFTTTNSQGTRFYALPDTVPINYNENKPSNKRLWSEILEKEKPDIIQVWGTEFTHGLCCLREAKDIPAVIYMQGLLEPISRYYSASITDKELRKTTTFRDIIKRDSILRQKKRYYRSAKKEQEMLRRAGNFISENNWCDVHVKAEVPEATAYKCPLSIGEVFTNYKWDIKKAEPHSVMCTASGYPLKGLHIMLKAIALLKNRYPDIKLYVPGEKQVSDGSIQWKLRKRGYTLYIERLIKKLGIESNIVWMGHVPQVELAQRLSTVRCFVLCSALENHSSSLKEAMMVGVPCVASAVGGVPEYVTDGENGLLYRFEEFELLADKISRIFEDEEICLNLSERGRNDMLKLHSGTDVYKTICDIYSAVIKNRTK